ncbi:TPA: hypothetical protein ACH3X2_000831 [Trebouxia sp. C0005]
MQQHNTTLQLRTSLKLGVQIMPLHALQETEHRYDRGGQSHLSDTIPDVARVSNQSFCIFGFAARCTLKPSVPCSILALHRSMPCLGSLHDMLTSGSAHTDNACLGGIQTFSKIRPAEQGRTAKMRSGAQ